MSFGNAFGAFASGAATGAALGQSFKGAKKEAAPSTASVDQDKPVGFELGQGLVSGDMGKAEIAGSEGSGESWGTLSAILGGLGGGGAAGASGSPGGAGAMLGLAAAPALLKGINPKSVGDMAAIGLGPALIEKTGGGALLGGLGTKLLKKIF